jgi:hypothetical protein
LVETEQHSVFPVASPGSHLLQLAGRVDNLNGIDSFELIDEETIVVDSGLALFLISRPFERRRVIAAADLI